MANIILAFNPGGLFNRLGKIGRVVADMATWQNTTLPNDITNLLIQYQGPNPPLPNPEPDLMEGVTTAQSQNQAAISAIATTLQQVGIKTLERMVYRSLPLNSQSNVLLNVQELIRQMQNSSNSVLQITPTGSIIPNFNATNVGNGGMIASVIRGDGLLQANLFTESCFVKCVTDAQTGGATSGNETFQFLGTQAQSNVFAANWPQGSGVTTNLQSMNPQANNSQGNMLVNSGFEAFTSNIPNSWVAVIGTGGTDIFKESSLIYSGAAAMRWAGGTGKLIQLTQQFNLSTGTTATLQPATPYAGVVFLKCDVVPASGVFAISLVDQNGAQLVDGQGVGATTTINLNGLTTSYAPFTFVFRTPKVLPASVRLRIYLTQVIPGGTNLYIDHLGFTPLTKLYPGGGFLSVYSGSIPWILGDVSQAVFTNPRGSGGTLNTWQTLFDRIFSMRQNDLLLPYAASPTINDNLI